MKRGQVRMEKLSRRVGHLHHYWGISQRVIRI
jgi:hypothetical protein